ncbi:tRNA3(Ser)-specific nuclease WapA [Thermoflexales bacterium]|nr:tRNA3(Ser)-specific nuclease WapA [Thermoflexales bacterium]
MKRTTLFSTLIMAVAMLSLLARVFPASAVPSSTPIALPTWSPSGAAQPIGAVCRPEAPLVTEANNLQITFMAQADAHVRQNSPTTNYSATTYLRTGRVLAPSDAYQTLVQFDISSLPANATIVTATLEMYAPVSSTPNLRAYAALGTWSETTVTWNTKPTYSTDYGSQTVNGLGWHKWNVTSLAQQWKSGTRTNYGFLMAQSGTTFGTLDYDSSENASLRLPRLTVIYATQGSPAILPVQADTWINQALPSTNYGTDSQLYVGRLSGNARNTLLKFDTSSLPSNAVIVTAALELYSEINLLKPEAPTDIWADAILSTWDESTVNWNTRPVTQTMGDLPKAYATGWLRWDVSNLVRGWFSGTIANHGIQLRLDPTGTSSYSFYARPANNAARLIVTYHTCTAPLTSVGINGATQGVTGTQYTFRAVPVPSSPTKPLTYTWRVTDLVCGGIHQDPCPTGLTFPYTFNTTGTKMVQLVAQNCGGTFTNTHQITITTPLPSCPNPISDVSLIGVSTGLTGTNYTFTATTSPIAPTTPITFTWEATDQTPRTTSGTITQTGQTFNWSSTGPKTITVTVQNCGAQSAAQATKAVDIVPSASLPDLIISSGWYEAAAGRAAFIIQNIGGSNVEPGPGYVIDIYQDDVLKSQGVVNEVIPPGGIRAGYINYTWFCASGNATAKFLADAWNNVIEGNEANNTWSDVWPCDQTPPRVTSGPTVLATTEHTATIRWQTNENVSYELRYGTNSGVYPLRVSSAALNTTHLANLSGLTADRVYHYTIVITDAAGTVINTPDYVFETKPACSDTPNIVGVTLEQYPYSLYEFYIVKASVVDATCVDKLDFFVDGMPIGTDYTPDEGTVHFAINFSPADKGFTRASFFKQHTLKVEGRSKAGTAASINVNVTPPTLPVPGKIEIAAPEADRTWYYPGTTVPTGKNLPITVNAYEYEWKCTWSGFSDNLPPELDAVHCADVDKVPQFVTFNLTGAATTIQTPAGNEYTYQYPIGGKAMGDYTLTACVRKSATDLACESQGVSFEQGAPSFEITRTVKRVGNYFEVNLLLHNLGTTDAYLDTLSDDLVGFQPATLQGLSNNTRFSTFYHPVSRQTDVDIDFFSGSANSMRLIPNGLASLSYKMVPILHEAPSDFAIGSTPLRLCYYEGAATGSYTCRDFPRAVNTVINAATLATEPLGLALNAAFSSSDYMITTNPGRLFDFYIDTDVPPVLESMAHLAYLKNGVIGYLDTYDVQTLDNIVERNGLWKNLLHPDFFVKNKGYLLIVGETEIVPSWYEGTDNFTTYPGIPDKVRNSDLRYAHTAGETARPELVVGRIVGNDPQTLVNGMSGSIAVAEGDAEFDRSHALLVSGRGDGVTSNFIPTVNIIADELSDDGVNVSKFHSYDVTDPYGEFVARTLDRDVIFYRDHGNEDAWSGVLGTNDVSALDFGTTRPVAFAAACLAGNYADDNDWNLPDAFMNKGVGAYIASTELSERGTNDYASKYFFRHWPIDQSVGVALNNTKIAAWDDDGPTYDHGKLWAFEYQLYGDPKFGKLTGIKEAALSLPKPTVPVTTLQVHVPSYEVEHIEGYDRVSIPGGLLRLEAGRYEVPYWQVTLDYPKGLRVANVDLGIIATPTITTGLQLITTTHQMDCAGCPVLPPPPLLDTATWVPPLDPKYEWFADVNADGSTTLYLKVYPFFYNPASTNIQFYQDFTFDIETYVAPVSIIGLDIDQTTYPLNSDGQLTLLLENTGAVDDFFVAAAIKVPVSDEVVYGLPLKSLHAFSGTASIDLPWSGAGLPVSDYVIAVNVLDSQGRVMDTATADITLGVQAGQVTALTAPTFFKPGMSVNASLVFNNAGDVPIDGMAYLEVYPTDSVTRTAIFTQTISNLQPAQSITVPVVWNTTGVSNGDYRLIGYVKYAENLTSNAKEVNLTTTAKVYLPLVLR